MLADRVSVAIGRGYNIPPPPTVAARIAGASEIAFSHFKSLEPQPGLSVPSPREEAFVFNVPLAPARYPIVSIDGRRQSVVQDPGKAYLFDLTSRNEVSLDTTYDSIRIHLPQTAIDCMAYEKGLPRVGGLRALCLGQDDAVLYHLALTLRPTILHSVPVTTAFMEYIALALHDHVIYTYGDIRRGTRASGGLTPWQVRRACDFIEANLADDPSIAELSRECGISASYFARAFRVTLGMTPHQWITSRRIERAKSLMVQTMESLAEIAIMCGFVDQSHLGRHFLRLDGISPAQWRRRRYTQ
ncbi:helix-turn-helix transcriptional regulator [Agrobacterium rhizogenes]|uniref:AraC family transcriptional regulator n=1 Tax=Rhizobium rhizogenes TaxID=359 RepID=UPI00157386C5|nr:AraC family transcriptional regulator [Rhizobium rhizogenes]NTH68541.1 helix-turn-helix transcriptional regulator [Rhizobium rhizogenes]NTI07157.1 helix-turn-helix transcriptional regulator [Rhizobium rhizogenes]NTI13971.1 helix-turn-helix transcriptional regulator [Rhizobium rhizogenes]